MRVRRKIFPRNLRIDQRFPKTAVFEAPVEAVNW
jgi:hypothetical protein